MAIRKKENIRRKPENIASQHNPIIRLLKKTKILPFLLALACLGIMFVLIRMKGIEQDYKMNEITKLIKKRSYENKELKADRARLLSVKQLEKFAYKYDLHEPDEKHIIVIPE